MIRMKRVGRNIRGIRKVKIFDCEKTSGVERPFIIVWARWEETE